MNSTRSKWGGYAIFNEVAGWKLRIRLDRWLRCDGPCALICMASPSAAGANRNDPTIWACQRLIEALGYNQFIIVNWEPFIAIEPHDLRQWRLDAARDNPVAFEDVHRRNIGLITQLALYVDVRIIAWGNLVPSEPHTQRILAAMSADGRFPLKAFGITREGNPMTPMVRVEHGSGGKLPLKIWRAPWQEMTT
jgi:hypothetical protein